MTPDELFPGFKTPPNDPSRDLKQGTPVRPAFTTAAPPRDDDDDDFADYFEDSYCEACDNMGYFNCFCGGDLCVCSNNGEIPCYECC